ncbi:hypothetical protein [Elstera sp.]|jgi:hypothetical protein|uniref:hypothetical protein n=1 Tax=Elstera sp. TaxID=1916664 RepID=UPI0037BE2ADC
MPRKLVTQAQIARAVKAVKAAGMTPTQVQVAPDGTVTVATGPAGAPAPLSPLDAWLTQDAARQS